MFTKTLNAAKSRISFTGVIPVVVLCAVLLLVPKAYAAGTVDSATDSLVNSVAVLMGMTITILNVLMWILFWMLELVTDNRFIFDPGMMTMIYKIWVYSRDVVNVAFAFLLVIGAVMWTVYPIVYAEQIKGLIPKFVAAVILVNFSWFIPRVIIDISNVTTYSIYQMPTIATGVPCTVPSTSGAPEPCKYVTNIAFLNQTDSLRNGMSDGNGTWECTAKPLLCVQMKNMGAGFTGTSNQSTIFNGLIVNYARLRGLVNLSDERLRTGGSSADIGGVIKMLVKYAIVLVIHIALFFPVLAMVAAFFLRIPVLWLTMGFMPFVALGYVIGDKLGELNPVEKVGKEFIRAAFLPVYVAVPFAVGFMLLNAGMAVPEPTGLPAAASQLPIFLGLRSFWQMFWLFIALGVLWTGVFAALKSEGITGKFTETIKNSGQALGQYAIKAPLSVPFIPMGKNADGTKNNVSLGGALGVVNPQRLLQKANSQIQSDSDRILSGGKNDTKDLHLKIDETIYNKIDGEKKLDQIASGGLTGEPAKKALKEALAEINKSSELKNLSLTQEQLLAALIKKRETKGKIDGADKFKDALKG